MSSLIGNVEVIGALVDQLVAGGGGGEPGVGYVELLDLSGTWPLGTTPGSITVTCPRGQLPDSFFSPNTPKTVRAGDAQSWVEFKNLWVVTSDPDQWDEEKSEQTTVLQDRRIWWHSRPPIGPRAYNIEQFGERLSPFKQATGSGIGSNPRYDPHSMRTGEQIIKEIFVWLGEDLGNVKLRGTNGWANLSSPAGRTLSILDDTPEWVIGSGTSPVEALEKFCAMYDLTVGISIDSMDVGFIHSSDIPKKLAATQAQVKSFMRRPLNPVEAGSYGFDREHLPDIVYISGAQIVIGDLLTLEPVCRDPDRPDQWIPLCRVDTMRAYGFNMSAPGRSHLKDGQDIARFAVCMAETCQTDNPLYSVPPRLYPLVREWWQIWQVAMPRETYTLPGDDVIPITITEDETGIVASAGASKISYLRIRSPRYRWARDQGAGSGTPTDIAHAPTDFGTNAQPHRFLPLLGHTEQVNPDGSRGVMRVLGCNALRCTKVKDQDGYMGTDWTNIGASIDPTGRIEMKDLADLGLDVGIIDAELGVVDLGVPVYGHDGETGAQSAVELLSGDKNIGTTVKDLWIREFVKRQIFPTPTPGTAQFVAPFGMPFLALRCAFHKKSHGNSRDFTSTYSEPDSSRSGDAFASAGSIDPALQTNIYTQASIGTLPPDPGSRSYPLVSYQTALPDAELRGITGRAASGKDGFDSYGSFNRLGGYASGALGGDCVYYDLEIDPTGANFAPYSSRHYGAIMQAFTEVVTRISEGIKEFRSTEKNIRVINAEICGIWRMFFPGVIDFASNPVDSVAFSGSGDQVRASMRIAANSRGWRPYVNSAVGQAMQAISAHRASAASVGGVMHGGGV